MHLFGHNEGGPEVTEVGRKRVENANFSSAAIIGVTQSARKQFPLENLDRPIFQAEINETEVMVCGVCLAAALLGLPS